MKRGDQRPGRGGGGPHSGATAHAGGRHENFTRPDALCAQAGLQGCLAWSFPPLSEHSAEGAPHSGPRGTEPEPLLLPLGGQAGRQAPGCGGQGLFPGTSGEAEQPGGAGRERRPARRTQEGARESVTQGIFCRVSAKLAEQTPEPGVRGQRDVASGPCGPPLPFLEKACFTGQNPTPDPPPRGRMFRKTRWSLHPSALLLPSPHPQGVQSQRSHSSRSPSVPRSGARLCLQGQHGFLRLWGCR